MPRSIAFSQSSELLVRIRQSGMKIALAASSDREDIAQYRKIIGIEDLVHEAASSVDAKAPKPEADIFAAALKKVGMKPYQAVAMGDTPWDAQAAGKLGIR